jgi:hypothetical protein
VTFSRADFPTPFSFRRSVVEALALIDDAGGKEDTSICKEAAHSSN